jgi:hypothetical protein
MKEKYFEAEMEIVEFESEDVITTSPIRTDDDETTVILG